MKLRQAKKIITNAWYRRCVLGLPMPLRYRRTTVWRALVRTGAYWTKRVWRQ